MVSASFNKLFRKWPWGLLLATALCGHAAPPQQTGTPDPHLDEIRKALSLIAGGIPDAYFTYRKDTRQRGVDVEISLSKVPPTTSEKQAKALLELLKSGPLRVKFVKPGIQVTPHGIPINVGAAPNATPGATYLDREGVSIVLLDPQYSMGTMPPSLLEKGARQQEITPAMVLAHEFGHAGCAVSNCAALSQSDSLAVEAENRVRLAERSPTRIAHDIRSTVTASSPNAQDRPSSLQLLASTESEALIALDAVRASLASSHTASMLELEVTSIGFGVRIRPAEVHAFIEAGSIESALAEIIRSDQPVEFGLARTLRRYANDTPHWARPLKFLSTQEFAVGVKFGGAFTIPRFDSVTGNIQVIVDPNSISDPQSCLEGIPRANLGESVAHELQGHALALLRRSESALIPKMALEAENEVRSRGGPERGRKNHHNTIPPFTNPCRLPGRSNP